MITYKSFTILPSSCSTPSKEQRPVKDRCSFLDILICFILSARASFYALRFYKAYYAPIDIVLLSFCHWVLNPRPLYRLVTFTYSTPFFFTVGSVMDFSL